MIYYKQKTTLNIVINLSPYNLLIKLISIYFIHNNIIYKHVHILSMGKKP